jgi:hypothetical protein
MKVENVGKSILTHKYKDAICFTLPGLGYLFVLLLGFGKVH